jgi:hypothetical protein
MKLKDILAISGKSGLYKFISQARNGIIVESFTDKKRVAIPSNAKVSALEDIAIFTDTEEVPLGDVFAKLFEKEGGKKTIDHKSTPDQLKSILESILPNYDREKVYVSDMKKLVLWYNLLLELNLLNIEEDSKEENTEDNKQKKENIKQGSKSASGATKSSGKEKTPAKTAAKKVSAKSTSAKPTSSSKTRTSSGNSTKSK